MAIWNTLLVNKLIEKFNETGILPKDNPFHQGDIRIRKPRINFEYTKEEIKELAKIADNVLYFGETYAKVTTDDGLKIVRLRKYQIKVLRQFQYYRHNIWLASRQIGKSCDGAIEIRDKRDNVVFNGELRDFYNNYVGNRRLRFKSFLCSYLPLVNCVSRFVMEMIIALIDRSFCLFSFDKDTIKSIDIKNQRLSICKEGGKNKMYVDRVHYCKPDHVIYFELEDDTVLMMSPEHIIHDVMMHTSESGSYEYFSFIEAQYIQIGAIIISKHNLALPRIRVVGIRKSYFKYSLYDLTTRKPHAPLPDHWYNINGVRVHNCVVSDTKVEVYDKEKDEYSTEQMFELFYKYKAKLTLFDRIERFLYRLINKLQHKYDKTI